MENGANFLAEGFLFSVATALIIGEAWRSSRNQSKQRSDVNDSIEELRIQMRELVERLRTREEDAAEDRRQYVPSLTYMTLLNSKADTRSLLASWAASSRSGCEVVVG